MPLASASPEPYNFPIVYDPETFHKLQFYCLTLRVWFISSSNQLYFVLNNVNIVLLIDNHALASFPGSFGGHAKMKRSCRTKLEGLRTRLHTLDVLDSLLSIVSLPLAVTTRSIPHPHPLQRSALPSLTGPAGKGLPRVPTWSNLETSSARSSRWRRSARKKRNSSASLS